MLRVLSLLMALCLAAPASAAETGKVLPPIAGIYHSANPDFSPEEDKVTEGRIARYERWAQKPLVWAYFSDNWITGIHFPAASAAIIRNHGAIPFVRLLARRTEDETCRDRFYSLQKIIDGTFDADLRAYARDVKAFGAPLMMEFGTEVNGNWFQWSGACNGGATTTGYGSPDVADGPERFRDAYRHIVMLFRAEGAGFVTWVFHVNGESAPDKPWNAMAAYYPGDDVVDWIGVSVYGALTPADVRKGYRPSLRSIMDGAYAELAKISTKPMALLEFGVTEYPGKPRWIRNALRDLAARRWPRIIAVSWWNDRYPNGGGDWSNLRVNSSYAALQAYRAGIGRSIFVTGPMISP